MLTSSLNVESPSPARIGRSQMQHALDQNKMATTEAKQTPYDAKGLDNAWKVRNLKYEPLFVDWEVVCIRMITRRNVGGQMGYILLDNEPLSLTEPASSRQIYSINHGSMSVSD